MQAIGIYIALGTQELGLHWACGFCVVCVDFNCVGYPMRTRVLVEYEDKTIANLKR